MSLFAELKRRNVFRVAAAYAVGGWLLVEIAALVFDAFEAPAWAIKVFISFAALGFPLALFFAWAYELTPEGIKREKEVDRAESITAQTGRKLDRIIILALSATIAVLLVDRFLLQPSPPVDLAGPEQPERARSVAVLPFVNMSGDEDNEYFADGITEELLNLLVDFEDLRVPSRTSSFAFKGQNMPIREIARQLDVAHVLEGSVRRAGDRVRVTAQLIDVAADAHLWSETYDRELEDIFAIQDDIAGQIVAALEVALAGEMPARTIPTRDMRAHELYLKGLHRFRNRGDRKLMTAVEQLEQAVAMDPEFAKAVEALAMVYLVLPGYQTPEQRRELRAEEALARARLHAERALELDSNLVEARAVKALVVSQEDPLRGLEQFEDLLEEHPTSSSSRLWYGILLLDYGYIEKARRQFEAALDVDPLSGINHHHMAKALLMLGEEEPAVKHARRAMELGRESADVLLGLIAIASGDYDRFRDAVYTWPSSPSEKRVADFLAEAGDDRSDQPELVAELLAETDGEIAPNTGAPFYWLGEADPYFDRLPADARANLGSFLETLWYPFARQYRQHPRFHSIAEELDMLKLWQERGWPDLCRPVDEGFECD